MVKHINSIQKRLVRLRLLLTLLIISGLFLLSGCKQEKIRKPLENDGEAPKAITRVQVNPIPGGAIISYTIPKDLDFLFVKAMYEIRPGVKGEAVSSLYDHTLVVKGFGDTDQHEITLVAVDRSSNKSTPVTINITPKAPPVQQAYASLSYSKDFGGINVVANNEAKGNLVFGVIFKDSTGSWVDYDHYYTGLPEVDFSVRGLPAKSTTFGVFVKDRWGNYSDTLKQTLTPLFETKLEKDKFSIVGLPTDAENDWNLAGLWNDETALSQGLAGFHSPGNTNLPMWFTFSLGIKAKLSRFRFWQVRDGREYSSGNIKQFQLWGSNNPNPDGSFDGWILLDEYEVSKPSGLPIGQLSNEDIETAAAGDEFTLPLNAPAVKYIRVKVLSTFAAPIGSSSASAWLLELSFWGQKME